MPTPICEDFCEFSCPSGTTHNVLSQNAGQPMGSIFGCCYTTIQATCTDEEPLASINSTIMRKRIPPLGPRATMRSATGRRSARVSDRTTFPEYGIPVCLDPNAFNTYDGPMQGVELGALLFGGKGGGSNPCTEMPCYVYPDQSQCDYGPKQALNATGESNDFGGLSFQCQDEPFASVTGKGKKGYDEPDISSEPPWWALTALGWVAGLKKQKSCICPQQDGSSITLTDCNRLQPCEKCCTNSTGGYAGGGYDPNQSSLTEG